MFRFFRIFFMAWSRRDYKYYCLLEEHELLIRAARRCAYDLGHAASDCREENFREMYFEAHQHWLAIFEKGGEGGKHYRHRLHKEIWRLEVLVDCYKKTLAEHGIEDEHDKVPF